MKPVKYAFLVIALCSALVHGAPVFELTPGDIQRLGIVFAPVTAANDKAGPVVPAEVINSPEARSTLSAPYHGLVEQWLVLPGARVVKGEVLAIISSADVVGAQQSWIAANNRYEQATSDLKKDQQLFAEGIIAEKRLAKALRNHGQAKFELDAASALLARAGFSAADLHRLKSGEINPGTYFISAPADGVLAERRRDVGDYVEAQTAVGILQQGSAPWLRAQIPVALAATLKQGQSLSLVNSDMPVTLRQKDIQINSATQTVEIMAQVTAKSSLVPGQIVSLILPKAGGGNLVPAAAVVHNGDDTLVFVRIAEGFEARQLVVESAGRDYLAVEGVEEGESVAIKGTAALKGIMLGLGGDE